MKTALIFPLQLLTLLFGLVLVSLGGTLLLFLFEPLKQQLLTMLQEQEKILPYYGLVLIMVGFCVGTFALKRSKRSYMTKVRGPLSLWIDEAVIEKLTAKVWQQCTALPEPSVAVSINKGLLHITVETSEHISEESLEVVQKELREEFLHTLGYASDFTLTICYRK